jgi:hypothetical protein
MALPDDVIAYVRSVFPADVRGDSLARLEAAVLHDGSTPEPRLLRCAAVACRGDPARLRGYLADLRIDYRNVIVEGEYDVVEGKLVRVRDLSAPILPGT